MTQEISLSCKLPQHDSDKKHIRFNKEFDIIDGEGSLVSARITRVLYKNPVTVVFWSDSTKTVAKCREGDTYNAETGIQVAMLKKLIGNSRFRDAMSDWLPAQLSMFSEANVTLADVRKKHKQ